MIEDGSEGTRVASPGEALEAERGRASIQALEAERGRASIHALEAERNRLLDACTALLAERGYDGIRVGELATMAGLSPDGFHRHFPDKQACVLAAYDRFSANVSEALFERVDAAATLTEFVDATLRAYVDVLERDPTGARAFYLEIDGAGDPAHRRRRETVHGFASMLAERHQQLLARDPTLAELPDVAYLGLAFAVRGLVQDSLLDIDGPSFREFAPGLAKLVSAAVMGAGQTEKPVGANE